MARPLIYDRGFENNIIGDTDTVIKNHILSNLNEKFVFINTTWIEKDQQLESVVSSDKISVCYSGPDWENTNCIDIRKQAHDFIKTNSLDVKYIGNTRGKYYFNFWAEFIRQNSEGFFDADYLKDPDFKNTFMCLNRKPHDHRVFLVDKLKEKNQIKNGVVSLGTELNPLTIQETLNEIVDKGEQAVYGQLPIKNDILTLGDPTNWKKHFINIVSETTVHTDVFISEKTWKPIIGLRPFLILGDNNIYEQLKELEFDTFDDVFGEWWLDKNWENRVRYIVSIVEDFSSKNLKKYHDILKPRLIKNRERFLTYIQENKERIDNLLCE